MPREKKTTLFSKNHITLEKYENVQPYGITRQELMNDKTGSCTYGSTSVSSKYEKRDYVGGKKIDKDHVEITKVSPLGFYYKQKINIKQEVRYARRTVKMFEYRYKDTKYVLSFYVTYDDNNVYQSEDSIRPWDIVPGDRDFSDRNIKDLTDELEKLFSIIEDNGCKEVHALKNSYFFYSYSDNYNVNTLNDTKREIYKWLFGNPKGLRTQTNEEKVLAHGFDLKTSFRKEKEA